MQVVEVTWKSAIYLAKSALDMFYITDGKIYNDTLVRKDGVKSYLMLTGNKADGTRYTVSDHIW